MFLSLFNWIQNDQIQRRPPFRAFETLPKVRDVEPCSTKEVSSRSHAILMLRLKDAGQEVFSSMPLAMHLSMSLAGSWALGFELHVSWGPPGMEPRFIVDLAGSERVARSGVTGEGFAEATNINLSLTALGRVVMALIESESAKVFIPYNASPLTMLLKAGLGGNSKTALIACVTQSADSLSESVSTLRFAMQASHVKNKVGLLTSCGTLFTKAMVR